MLKRYIGIGLVVFAGLSLGYLIFSELIPIKENSNSKTTVAEENPSEPNSIQTQDTDKQSNQEKVIVYYFHGRFRCPTCRTIEEYTKECINKYFSEYIDSGKLELKIVNLDEPENEHFINDFQLATRCVVIEKKLGNTMQAFSKLEKVWDLVHGSKEEFCEYIQNNLENHLN